jgi:RHS repeat-associated protein
VAVKENSTITHVYADHLGSTGSLSNSSGTFITGSHAKYTPFGDWRVEPTATAGDSRYYTNHKANNLGGGADDLGLTYMNARFYVSNTNRFASPDTIVPDFTDPQSLNRYSYTLNNPLKYVDPDGHCATVASPDGTLSGRDLENDGWCWQKYDELKSLIDGQNNTYIEYYGFDLVKWEEIAGMDWRAIQSRLDFHQERINLPLSCNGGGGHCSRDKWSQMVDNFWNEVLPDAVLIGANSGIQGGLSQYYGGEVLWGADNEVGVFTYKGQGAGGFGESIDVVPFSVGTVWNLDNLDDYEGAFWSLTADFSIGKGASVTVFGSPGEYPGSGGTWGISVGYVAAGIGANVSVAETNYTRRGIGSP